MNWGDVIEVLLLILAVGVLVFINGFFVAAELHWSRSASRKWNLWRTRGFAGRGWREP